MSKIRDDSYYVISGWMVDKLKLKGNELSIFAIIYGFSQDEDCEFAGSIQYMCDFLGGVSRPTVSTALKNLVQKGFITRREEIVNGVQFNRYKANLGVVKNFYGGSKEILHNKEEYNIEEKENIKDNSFIKEKELNLISGVNLNKANNSINHSNVDSQTLEFSIGARFKKPTIEQVAEYCKERNNGIDAEGVVNFYEAKGWKIGKSPMKDWKAAVRTWERNRKQVNKTYGKTPNTPSKCTTLTINEVLDIRTANSNKGEVEYE